MIDRFPRRLDIQLLRGVSVLLVLGYHGFPGVLPFGFLGVDVFFVISGFLMTRLIVDAMDEGHFSLGRFYLRRARRLLPAAMATMLAVTALASVLASHAQWYDFLWQLFGAATFTANLFLWEQGGYFDAQVETRPLLHFWSLAVEEQFYLLFPLVLLAIPRRLQGIAIGLGLAGSLALSLLVSVQGHVAMSFYLLPTRGWELLAGAAAALAVGTRPGAQTWRLPRFLSMAALAAVGLLCVGVLSTPLAPLLVVGATVVILVGRDGWLPDRLPTRGLARIGDWSYSLYLVHWPLLAFANTLYAGLPPAMLILLLLGASLPLAWLQYRFVEQRFRYAATRNREGTWLAGAAILSAAIILGREALQPVRGPDIPDAVVGIDRRCADGREIPDESRCRTSPRPRIAIWGDSFAMHAVPGLLSSGAGEPGLAQYTKPGCAPIVGMARRGDGGCVRFNRRTIEALLAAQSIRVVVLASSWELLAKETPRLVVGSDQSERVANRADIVAALSTTIGRIQADGKTVIIIGPTPLEWRGALDPPNCNIRELEGRLVLGRRHCMIPLSLYRQAMPAVNQALGQVADRTGAALFLPEQVLCRDGLCATRSGRHLLYRDSNHLSQFGSLYVIGRLGVGQAVAEAVSK